MISHDVLGAYAADAAREVSGVAGLVDGPRRHHGVRVTEDDGTFALEVHIEVEWGERAADVGGVVQRRVAEYVRRTARIPVAVDVVVSGVAAAAG